MAAVEPTFSSSESVASASGRSLARGRSVDRIVRSIGVVSIALLAVVVVGMVASVVALAWPLVATRPFDLSLAERWDPARGAFGSLPFVWGTFVTSTVALALSVPVSLGVAWFLTDLGPRRVRGLVSTCVELLAAVPSVVYGLWGALVLAPFMRDVVEPVLVRIGGPLFRGPPLGFDLLTASLLLALMVVPTIAAVSRDVLRAVPTELREAALALGATPLEVFTYVTLPHARRGILGAVVLGFGRAASETMAVASVIGSRAVISTSLLSPGASMSSVLANEFSSASSELHVAALARIGLWLFVVSVLFNVIARMLVARVSAAGISRSAS